MAIKAKYPRQEDLFKNPITNIPTKEQIGKPVTIPGQAMSLKDIIERSISGFPVPMQREQLNLHDDINQVLEGTRYDIVSDAKFKMMSKIERATVLNNMRGLKQQLSEKLGTEITAKELHQQQIDLTPPTPPEPKPPTA